MKKKDFDIDKSIRPSSFDRFIGQNNFVGQLKIFIAGAKGRNEVLDHCLFSGPPGLGKTTLANILANSMGGEFIATTANILEEPKDIYKLLAHNKPFILFIDEIHRLKKQIEEVLYKAMEDRKVDVRYGSGRIIELKIPAFTLIGATTRAGMLSQPLRERFQIKHIFETYSPAEISVILRNSAEVMGYKFESGVEYLSGVCRGTPRIANNLLRRIRDFLDSKVITEPIIKKALDILEIDKIGLTKSDRKILEYLATCDVPVGLKNLAVILNEEPETIEEVIEPYLVKIGFIKRTSRGRVITQEAISHLGLELNEKILKNLGII